MRVVLVDPPIAQSRPGDSYSRFAFSDIVWSYARYLRLGPGELYLIGSYREPPAIPGVTTICVPARTWHFRNVAAQYILHRQYALAARRLAPTIIHSPDYYGLAIIARSNSAALPIITTPGSILERTSTFNPYGGWGTKTLQWATAVLRKRSAFVVATSRYMARWWERSGFAADRMRVLPLPVEMSAPQLSPDAARAILGWQPDAIHLLSPAALRAEMNLDLAVDLFARAVGGRDPSLPQVHLHLVGDGPMRSALAGEVAARDLTQNVTLHGSVPPADLSTYYMAADATIISRRYNATPRTAQEALIYGSPLIANLNESLTGFSEAIDQSICQFDFGAPDAERALSGAVQHALSLRGDRPAIAAAARSVFGAENIASELRSIYRSLVPGAA